MARPRKFDEDQVLLHALETFWRQGYDATTFRELEKVTGVGLRSLNNTFGEKDALFARALRVYREQAEEELNSLDLAPGVTGIIAFFEGFAKCTECPNDAANGGCLMLNSMMELRDPPPAVAAEIEIFQESLKSLFRDGLTEDGIMDADARSEYLVGALWGILVQIRTSGRREASAAMVRIIIETIRNWTATQCPKH